MLSAGLVSRTSRQPDQLITELDALYGAKFPLIITFKSLAKYSEPEETAGVCPAAMRVYRGRFHRNLQESWMHRMAGFLLLTWLATSAAAQAQVVSQSIAPNGTTSATSTSATGTFDTPPSMGRAFRERLARRRALRSSAASPWRSAAVPVHRLLPRRVRVHRMPRRSFAAVPAGGPVTTGLGSAGVAAPGISASPSINPQSAVQLPGEAPNTSTQGANTTASSAAAGFSGSSSIPCSPTIPSATGTVTSAGALFGSASLGGC